MAVDPHGAPVAIQAVQVVAAGERQDRPGRQRGRVVAGPRAPDDGRWLLANSTTPQPSTPSSTAMRREARTKTSAGAMPEATAVASSRMTACSSEMRASSTRPTTTTKASEPKMSTALTESAAVLWARAWAS